MAEFSENSFYTDNGLKDGAYYLGEDGIYHKSSVLVHDSGQLNTAVGFNKCCGLELIRNVDLGYADTYQDSLDKWMLYPNTGFFWGSRTTQAFTQEDSKTITDIHSKSLEYMTKNCANFITGKSNFEKDWDKWCTVLKKYRVDNISALLQTYVDNYPFR